MPNAERYARDKEYYLDKNKEYRTKNPENWKDICHRSYVKHKKERLELAHVTYLENIEKENSRAMAYYRKKHPIVLRIRKRKKGEQWPPKTCPTCENVFVPAGENPNQIYCSSLCFYKKKGYLNLQQYKNSTVTTEVGNK